MKFSIITCLILFSYIYFSLISPLHINPLAKFAAASVLLAVCMKYIIYEKLGGSFIAPDLPAPVLLFMEMFYSSAVVLLFLLIIKDIVSLLIWSGSLFGLTFVSPISPLIRNVGLVAVSVVFGVFGTWQSVIVPKVKTVNLSFPDLNEALNGLSVVQLTDIHIGSLLKRDWLEQVVERTNAVSPDLILITGDMIDGTPESLRDDISPLRDLKARYGVYGVTGNHEYYFKAERWIPVFKGLGIDMLENEHRTLIINHAELVIAGVPDKTARRFGGHGPDVQAALADAPDAFRILMAHQPIENTDNQKVDLQLSGHTHGGHMPILKQIVARFNKGLVSGVYDLNGKILYLSSGTGLWSGFSFRLGVPSEITRIVLYKE